MHFIFGHGHCDDHHYRRSHGHCSDSDSSDDECSPCGGGRSSCDPCDGGRRPVKVVTTTYAPPPQVTPTTTYVTTSAPPRVVNPAGTTTITYSSSNSSITPQTLRPATKEGYLTKQGEWIKSWKRRWFVLKADRQLLYYFVSTGSYAPQGTIGLRNATLVRNQSSFPHYSCPTFVFAIDTPNRRYFIEADNKQAYVYSLIVTHLSSLVSAFYIQRFSEF